jgi:hypothetical protein
MLLASPFRNLDTRYQYPLYLCLLAGLLFFPFLGTRDFWAPVEPRCGEIVRVMFLKGEWIVPKINGNLYTDKPILYFWLALIASKIAGGVSEWTVRLPGGWRWLYLSDLFHRTGFFHRSRRLARRCGTRHLHARYLGVSLGACRHGLLLLLRAVDLLRRALSVTAQGESLRNSSCLRLYGAGHVNQGSHRRRSAGADICCAHARSKGLAHDR